MEIEHDVFIVYDEKHAQHKTRKDDPCEIAERVDLVKNALLGSGLNIKVEAPNIYEHPLIKETHSPEMIELLQRYSDLLKVGDEAFTKFCSDSAYSTPILKGTYDQAVLAASNSIHSSELLIQKKTKLAFSLSRPPGHHAGYDFYHGFCFINNAALAARNLRNAGAKVAVLDFDIHHGDGTQDIFFNSGEALFVSVHADPSVAFPFTGFPEEIGEGLGKGLIVNIPVDIGVSTDRYKEKFGRAIKTIDSYNPDVLVVSAGFDGHEEDHPPGRTPLAGLTADDYGYLGYKIGGLNIPSSVVFEGGYNLEHLPDSVNNFINSLNKSLVRGIKTNYE